MPVVEIVPFEKCCMENEVVQNDDDDVDGSTEH